MDLQISLFSNFFIKNGSHDTIYTFKNYFASVFSVFSFQFQQNKSYPNRPYKFEVKRKSYRNIQALRASAKCDQLTMQEDGP